MKTMTQKVQIRKATRKDLPILLELATELFAYHANGLHNKNYLPAKNAAALRKKHYIEMLNKPKERAFFIAEINHAPIGMIIAAIEEIPPVYIEHKRGSIREFYVREAYRKLGIGKKLMQTATKWLREKKLKTIGLQCWYANTPSRNAYEKMGFKAIHVKYEKNI